MAPRDSTDIIPPLRTTVFLQDNKEAPLTDSDAVSEHFNLYDVQFYPYARATRDNVFAATGGSNTFICRVTADEDSPVEVLQVIVNAEQRDLIPAWKNWVQQSSLQPRKKKEIRERAPDKPCIYNSLTWSKDVETGDPLLLLAGASRSIDVWNVQRREIVKTLVAHGGSINDLTVSPISPQLIASCSRDKTILLWHLGKEYESQPCLVEFAGSHKESVESLGFHKNGRYLLSGSQDTSVKLWIVPDLSETKRSEKGLDEPRTIKHPAFSSSEIHTNIVDCIQFHRDLIVSKAAMEDRIVVWKVDNFDSSTDIPKMDAGPSLDQSVPHFKHGSTRSIFGGRFQILFTLDSISAQPFYNRFGLFSSAAGRALLALGNDKSKICFWDFQKLEDDCKPQATLSTIKALVRSESSAASSTSPDPPIKPTADRAKAIRNGAMREGSVISTLSGSSDPSKASGTTSVSLKRKREVDDPIEKIEPHRKVHIRFPDNTWAMTRRVAINNSGNMVVSVGDKGSVTVFRR